MTEFKPWPKTPRLFRDIVITEKIDGTNAAIHVEELVPFDASVDWHDDRGVVTVEGGNAHRVTAQSRNRLIYPGADNYGFAGWVAEHGSALATILGPGTHYGEWWGSGIQRGYGLTKGEKRFSLFNVHRYADLVEVDGVHRLVGLDVVPTLYVGPFSTAVVDSLVDDLRVTGSRVAPGFMRPEGVVVYHSAARSVFKVLLEGDDRPKGAAA